MIIGKSLTALGGGGLKPEIIVTAKAGALLNLYYKGSSIILQSYQLGVVETQHTFIVDVSETAYVVKDATNNAIVEVLVDVVALFTVNISYGFNVYIGTDSGESYYSMPWHYKNSSTSSPAYCTLAENSIYGSTSNTGAGCRFVQFETAINFSKFSNIHVKGVFNNSSLNELILQAHTNSTTTYEKEYWEYYNMNISASPSPQEFIVSLSDNKSTGYLSARVKMTRNAIYKIWLE